MNGVGLKKKKKKKRLCNSNNRNLKMLKAPIYLEVVVLEVEAVSFKRWQGRTGTIKLKCSES